MSSGASWDDPSEDLLLGSYRPTVKTIGLLGERYRRLQSTGGA